MNAAELRRATQQSQLNRQREQARIREADKQRQQQVSRQTLPEPQQTQLPDVSALAKAYGVSSSALLEAQAYVDRKLSGRRVTIGQASQEVQRAYQGLLNDPENLRALSNIYGRSALPVASPSSSSSVEGFYAGAGFKAENPDAVLLNPSEVGKRNAGGSLIVGGEAKRTTSGGNVPVYNQGGIRSVLPEARASSIQNDVFRSNENFLASKTSPSYNPQLNAFITESPTGRSATGYIRQPTLRERQIVESAQYRGDFFGKDTEKIVKAERKFEESKNKFFELISGFDSLTPEQQADRIKKLEKLGAKINENGDIVLPEPFIEVGFGKDKRKVLLSELDTKTTTGLYFSGLRNQLGYYVEKGAEKVGIPETTTTEPLKINVYQPQYGTQQYDPLTGGKNLFFKEVEIPSKTEYPRKELSQGVQLGTYFIPYVFASEEAGKIGESVYREQNLFGGAKSYVKNYPTEALIVGTIGVSKVGTKAYQKITNPIITRDVLTGETKVTDPFGFVTKPTERKIYYDPLTGQAIQRETGSQVSFVSQQAKEGSRTIINTPRSLFFQRVYRKIGVPKKYVSTGLGKPIYEGVYGADKEGYKTALKKLGKLGYTENQAKEILRLRRPAVIQDIFKGEITTEATESGFTSFLGGKNVQTYLKGQKGGVNYLQKKPVESVIADVSVPYKSQDGIQFFSFERKVKTPSKPLGKTTETFLGRSGVKSFKEYPELNIEQFGIAEASKKVNPNKRSLELGGARVFVQKGEPEITIIDTSLSESKGFFGGGKRSSDQFYQDLYKVEGAKASQVLELAKKPIKKPSVPKQPQQEFVSPSIPETKLGLVFTGKTQAIIPETRNVQPTSSLQEFFNQEQKNNELGRIFSGEASRKRQKGRSLLKEVSTQPQQAKESVLDIVKNIQSVSQKQSQKQRQESLLEQKQTQEQVRALLGRATRTNQRKVKSPEKRRFRLPFPKEESFSSKKVLEEVFSVFGRRRGKDIKLGSFESQLKAEQSLKKFLTGTLGRSGFISKGGEKLDVNLGFGFRPSKTRRKVVVQKTKFSLSSSGEKVEILKARKKKGKRKKKLSWF